MTVVRFPRVSQHEGWHPIELQQFVSMSSGAIAMGEASTWEIGVTERNDPQFFLIGPPPERDCILAISRLGRLYVIEDGTGRVLFESNNPMPFRRAGCRGIAPPQDGHCCAGRGRLGRCARVLRGEDGSGPGRAHRSSSPHCPTNRAVGLTFCPRLVGKSS